MQSSIAQHKKQLEKRRIDVLGMDLHYLFVPGLPERKASPIVLVCGLGVSSEYMIPAALLLAEISDVYCPDMPGFGKSSKEIPALNVAELAGFVSAFMERKKITRAVIAGHSFGCQISVEFASRYPDKLERLVLAAPSGDPSATSIFRYLVSLALDSLREPFSMTIIAVRDYLRAGLKRAFRTFQFSVQDRIEDKLGLVWTPTLVIKGSKDPVVSGDWAREVSRLLPNGKLVTIEGAAHAVNYNSPREFACLIQDFLRN